MNNANTQKIKDKKARPYNVLNIKHGTRKRIDKIYYSLKLEKGYKSYDDFISEILDSFEKK